MPTQYETIMAALSSLGDRMTIAETDIGWMKKMVGWAVLALTGIFLGVVGILGTLLGKL